MKSNFNRKNEPINKAPKCINNDIALTYGNMGQLNWKLRFTRVETFPSLSSVQTLQVCYNFNKFIKDLPCVFGRKSPRSNETYVSTILRIWNYRMFIRNFVSFTSVGQILNLFLSLIFQTVHINIWRTNPVQIALTSVHFHQKSLQTKKPYSRSKPNIFQSRKSF